MPRTFPLVHCPELDLEAIQHRVAEDRWHQALLPGMVVRAVGDDTRVYKVTYIDLYKPEDPWEEYGTYMEVDLMEDADNESFPKFDEDPPSQDEKGDQYDSDDPEEDSASVDLWPSDTRNVIAVNADERASFCEMCDVTFRSEFVKWSHDVDNDEDNPVRPRWPRPKSSLSKMWWMYSCCRRCAASFPVGKVLWRHLRYRFKALSVVRHMQARAALPVTSFD